ncbi:PQQ-binding-like beta-propeller repeat protein, partial [Candidatus Micrarchaeota archaeon]|nr:PQQ-binding-like beta-propeller repeat protein [Candidatus Micrarchaeota archaeon]
MYQLNSSNISQQIENFTTGGSVIQSSPAVAGGYVYIGDNGGIVHQLNASNISQEIRSFTIGSVGTSSPAFANGYFYIGDSGGLVYQFLVTAPVVSLSSPADTTSTRNTTLNFIFNTTDDVSSTLNCSLYINDTLNQTNESTINGESTTFTISDLAIGSYNWTVSCTYGDEHTTNSSTYSFTINEPLPYVDESSETDNLSEWRMRGRYLNHTAWDGIDFPVILGLNQTTFTTGGAVYSSSPA